MKTGLRAMVLGCAMLAAAATAGPALADVKAGVDAWARGDYKAAVEQWRAPAVAGDADAQFNLGQAYKLGRGVPVDLVQAESWYAKAAAQGHLQAQDNYGLALFQNGKRDQSLPWIQKSVARAEPRAQYVLGTMLFNGDGLPKDWVRAYALMTRASAAGLPQASATLGQMDRYISLADRQQGTLLAQKYEAEAARPNLDGPNPDGAPRDVASAAPRPVPATPSRPRAPVVLPDPERAAPAPVVREPRPAPVQTARPAVEPATGRWRVQFGAFRDDGNARGLWQTLKGRYAALDNLQPFLVKAGALTKLQAGPIPSSAAAARICAAVKPAACVPVAP